jgi:Cupredoxin-like domain
MNLIHFHGTKLLTAALALLLAASSFAEIPETMKAPQTTLSAPTAQAAAALSPMAPPADLTPSAAPPTPSASPALATTAPPLLPSATRAVTGNVPSAAPGPQTPRANLFKGALNTPPEGTRVAENEQTTDDKPALDNKQIRKLLSSQPDPSVVLEPIVDPPPKPKPPPPPPPAPPQIKALPQAQAPDSLKTNSLPGKLPTSPELSVILVGNQFYPSRLRLKDGMQTKIYFTTTNEKAAAIVIERTAIQRWVAKEGERRPASELERSKLEITREVTSNKVTEVLMDPVKGSYSFHDALSGAKGQMIVEDR